MRLPKRKRHTSYKPKRNEGFSVLFVLSVGLTALLGVMAVTDALVSAQRNVASQVYMNEATSAAENALQYAIGVINSASANGQLSSLGSTITIPSQIAGNATVTVSLNRVPAAPLYSANYTPIWNLNTFPASASPTNPPFYLSLSCSAKVNSFQRTINIILGPNFTVASTKTPTNAYFNGALFGNQSVSINGVDLLFEPGYTQSANSFAQQVVSSNNQIQINGSSTISGSLNAASYSVPPMTVNGQGVHSSTVLIEGNVSYTGTPNPYSNNFLVDPGNVTPTPGANVLGDGQAGGLGNQQGAVTNNAVLAQTAPAEVQTASGAAQFTSTGSSGNLNTFVQTPPTSQVVDLGALSSSGTGSVSLSSGQYVANSIVTSPDSTLNINATTGATGIPQPVQIFVQGNTDNGIPLQLQGNINMAGAPPSASNLQFYYNGSQSIVVTMGSQNPDFYGQIYAPNANVTVDTSNGAFHGSVVANNLTVIGRGSNPGKFYYDPRTINPSGGGPGAAGPGYTPNSGGTIPTSFYVLSWQEQPTGAQ